MKKNTEPLRIFSFPIELEHDVESYHVFGWKLRADPIGTGNTPADYEVTFHNLNSSERLTCDQSRIETYPEECQRLYEHFIALLNGYRGMRNYLGSSPPIIY